ncbi:Protein OS-9 [Dinochytrium kinnereticum]|nr:Protein OS-9 [Dinochytrium kinnereticum]
MEVRRILIAAAALAASASALTTDAVYLDIFSNPKHQVVFGTLPGHLPITPFTLTTVDVDSDPSLLLLPDASTGKTYLCHVPPPSEVIQDSPKSDSAEDKKKTVQTALRLLEPMASKDCLYYIHGWWTYEFCHNRHVRQFHQRTKEEELANPDQKQDYILGRFPAPPPMSSPASPLSGEKKRAAETKDVAEPLTELEERSLNFGGAEIHDHEVDGKSVAYLKQVWGDGTACEVGQVGPRSAEIQYHCNPYFDQISAVRETGSCRYLIHIQTKRLCSDPAFLPKQVDHGTSIVCEPVLSTELLESATPSKKGRETYTPPPFSHFQQQAGKGLVGIRDLLTAEYIAKAAAAGLPSPPPKGFHSIQAVLERVQQKRAAAAAAASALGSGLPSGAASNNNPITLTLKNGAAIVAAAAAAGQGAVGANGIFDLRDPLVANLINSEQFSELLKKVTSAVADSLSEEDDDTAAVGKDGGKVSDDEAMTRAFQRALKAAAAVAGEGNVYQPKLVLTEDGRLVIEQQQQMVQHKKKKSGQRKKRQDAGKTGAGGVGKNGGVGNGRAGSQTPPSPPEGRQGPGAVKAVPKAVYAAPEVRSPDDDDEDG